MRCINNQFIHCPSDWEQRAKDAYVKTGDDLKKISNNSDLWRELKDTLASLSHDKCWYCEVKQIRSDDAVDHFRPKSRYPWLAFDKKNYRYSCTYCNSKRKNPDTSLTEGKGDDFPLLEESKRAKSISDNLDDESPMLLDPCQMQDPGYLDFLENGIPCPIDEDDETIIKRVKASIHLYHLDHPAIVEKRRRLGIELKDSVEKAIKIKPFCNQGNSIMDQTFSILLNRLSTSMSETSELSVFARRFIAGYREHKWIENLIFTA